MNDVLARPARPRSVTSEWVPLVTTAAFVVGVVLAQRRGLSVTQVFLASLLGFVVVQAILELFVRRVHRYASTGLVFEAGRLRRNLSFKRTLVKLAGMYLTLGVLALIYFTVPEYSESFYRRFWGFLRIVFPYFAVLSVPYFLVIDALQANPRDGYWYAANLFAFRFKHVDWRVLNQYALGWVIKGFYLPLMCSYLMSSMVNFGAHSNTSSIIPFVYFVAKVALLVDLGFVVIGYTLTLRILDSHIRSTNPYLWGWIACIVLYKPFWGVVGKIYYYNDGTQWYEWFANHQVLLYAWAVLIMLAKLSWAWTNTMYSFRFSNLTHRGIITNGPYRFTKHPSYVSKNIAWWLLTVPFLSASGPLIAAQHCAALLGVNILYAIRARSEELHLSEEPTYVEYAEWIEEHGVFRWMGRLIPALRYRPPSRSTGKDDAGAPPTPLGEKA